MGGKLQMNFLLATWVIVPVIMFATKVFRMDAKDRHGVDMRMKHHSTFWVKGNVLVDGHALAVLRQVTEGHSLRGIDATVATVEGSGPEAGAGRRGGWFGGASTTTKAGDALKAAYVSELGARKCGADSVVATVPDAVWAAAAARHIPAEQPPSIF